MTSGAALYRHLSLGDEDAMIDAWSANEAGGKANKMQLARILIRLLGREDLQLWVVSGALRTLTRLPSELWNDHDAFESVNVANLLCNIRRVANRAKCYSPAKQAVLDVYLFGANVPSLRDALLASASDRVHAEMESFDAAAAAVSEHSAGALSCLAMYVSRLVALSQVSTRGARFAT